MKSLLNAIREALRAQLTDIRPGDIFIAPHADFVPNDVKFPAIGIKDGGISRTECIGSCMEYSMDVIIVPWVLLQKPEASIMGDDGTSRQGVLEIADAIHEALDENLLNLSGLIEAFSPSETGSETMGGDARLMQKKNINYRYVKQGDRP